MNKRILKIGLTLVAIIALVTCTFFLKKNFTSKRQGYIIVELVSLQGKQMKEKEIAFSEGDKLVTLLEENFNNVKFDNGMLMNIENYETPEDWSTFLAVYVDDEMSQVGIPEIKYRDGTKISLKVTEYEE